MHVIHYLMHVILLYLVHVIHYLMHVIHAVFVRCCINPIPVFKIHKEWISYVPCSKFLFCEHRYFIMAQGGEHEGTQDILSNNQQHGEDHEGLDVSLPTTETPVRAHNTRQHRQDRSDTYCQGELVHARVDLNVMLCWGWGCCYCCWMSCELGQVNAATCTCSLRLARVHSQVSKRSRWSLPTTKDYILHQVLAWLVSIDIVSVRATKTSRRRPQLPRHIHGIATSHVHNVPSEQQID
jgi:hypothetical protein